MSGVLALSAVRATLDRLSIHPSRALGQNFLHDRNLAAWITGQLDPSPDGQIIEIGPGLGALTGFLVERGQKLTLIEKDPRLAEELERRWPQLGADLHVGDAADFDPRPLFPYGPARLIGNLPYRASAPIAFRFFSPQSPVEEGIVMVQKEFARRLAASPSNRDFGIPSLILGRRWKMRALRRVGPSVFYPRPEIESAVVEFTPREAGTGVLCEEAVFEELVHRGFAQRRKQLRRRIGMATEDWEAFCAGRGLAVEARAEGLGVADWEALAARVKPLRDVPVEEERFDVVDECDRVVGDYPRSVVHVNNWRHRAVHVFLRNARGELLLQKRSAWKDRHAGVWDSSASGHVTSGQKYFESAFREVKEEVGVDMSSLDLGLKLSASPGTDHEFVELYLGRHDGPVHPDPREVERAIFFPLEVVDEWVRRRPEDFAPAFMTCYREGRSLLR